MNWWTISHFWQLYIFNHWTLFKVKIWWPVYLGVLNRLVFPSDSMDTCHKKSLNCYLQAIKGNMKFERLSDPVGVPTPAMFLLVLLYIVFHLETNLKVCWVRVPAWLDVSQLHNRHDNDLSGFLKTSNESKNLEHLSNRFRIFTCDRIALIMYLPLPGLRSCWEQIGRRFLAWQGMFLVLLIP